MKENEILIIPLRVNKTKSGKSILQFAIKDEETSYSKGLTVLQQWFDTEDLFNNLSVEDTGKPCKGTFEYKKTFNGLARINLTSLVNSEGKDLLV